MQAFRSWIVVMGAPLALMAAGCGSSPTPSSTATTAATTTASAGGRSPVSVLGAGVRVSRDAVAVDLRLRQPADTDPPLARRAELTLPAGISWHGDAAPACPLAQLRAGGPDACPPGSVLGAGVSIGLADRTTTKGQITVVNGGPGTALLSTVVRNPAYVKTVVPGRIAPAPGGGLRVTLTFPPELQTIAGVPVGLQRLQLKIDRGRVLQTGDCSGDRRYRATVTFTDGTTADNAGTADCRTG